MATSTTPQPYTAGRPENSTTSVDANIYTVFGRKWDQDLRASGAPAAPLAPSCRL